MSGDVKRPTREDVAHLRAGMEVVAKFSNAEGDFEVKGPVVDSAGQCLFLGGFAVRYPDGNPGLDLVEVVSPKPPKPVYPVGTRLRTPDGGVVEKTDDPRDSDAWVLVRGFTHRTSREWFSDAHVEGWEVIRDVPEVPDDVIEAAARAIYEGDASRYGRWTGLSAVTAGEYMDNARGLARRGLLVGSVPENVIPDGHVTIDLDEYDTDELRMMMFIARGAHLGLADAISAELKNRVEL